MTAPAKKKIGPPFKPVDQVRTARVEIRTTPERKARAERLAEAAGLSIAGWWERKVDAEMP
jgi:hypothetical protein